MAAVQESNLFMNMGKSMLPAAPLLLSYCNTCILNCV